MNSSDHDHESLLSDLFEGPNVEAVVATIRREKVAAQRRHRFAAGAAITLFVVCACLFSLIKRPSEVQPIAHFLPAQEAAPAQSAATSEPSAFPMEHINDEQLIALLEGTPVALVHLPSGEQRLLLMEDRGQGEAASIISL
ncbi:MAG: hypothetical protein ACO1QR_03085 [Chthoniobacteraceae bacterium]